MKILPVGISDFKEIRTGDYYYVDKSMLIKDAINNGGKVTLYTRPRRFGKSLNMSMLKNFFEIGSDPELFYGLWISEDREFREKYQGKYPVITLSLKDVDGRDFPEAFQAMCYNIFMEARRHSELSESSILNEIEKESYSEIVDYSNRADLSNPRCRKVISESLKMMTVLLSRHYGVPAVVLIDEYDVPLDKAHVNGYYDEMVRLIRSMFSSALKDNTDLAFCVLTGCLRVTKESIFTGMNNFCVNSITDDNEFETFGFTEAEVDEMMSYYEISDRKPEAKDWYDGYIFGTGEVYCPWDMVNFCKDISLKLKKRAYPYWSNSSGNALVREFVDIASEKTASELEALVNGERIKKKIREELTYRDIDNTIENLWSVLYLTGYLTGYQDEDGMFMLWIPNKEVRTIYIDDIVTWFHNRVKKDAESSTAFYNAAFSEDAHAMQDVLNTVLFECVSLRDFQTRKYLRENFYHGMLIGLLSGYKGIDSNSDAGNGYSDITMADIKNKTAVILELKYADSDDEEAMENACNDALKQIEDMKYEQKFTRSGLFRKVIKYGISFNLKLARVKMGEQ